MNSQNAHTTIEQLITSNVRSARTLSSISEQIKNGAVKILLTTYAQERKEFAYELQGMDKAYSETPPHDDSPINTLDRGWKDIKIAMTVGTENQEEEAFNNAVESERETLQEYESALEEPLPDDLRNRIAAQQQRIAHEYKRLLQLSGNDDERLIMQLFNSPHAAQDAVEKLQQAGYTSQNIAQEPISPNAKPLEGSNTQRARSANSIVITGALLGALLGLILGVGLGILRINFDPQVTLVEVGWSSVITSGLIGLLIAASFGSFFGFFIGRNAVEEDAHIYNESLEEGSTIVFVSTDATRVDDAADLMRAEHQQELVGVNG